MELSLIGLKNAGKTSLVNIVATGGYSEDMIPTVDFNMKKVTKVNVTIKWWDLGGQPRFRTMWERYCRAVPAIMGSDLPIKDGRIFLQISSGVEPFSLNNTAFEVKRLSVLEAAASPNPNIFLNVQ